MSFLVMMQLLLRYQHVRVCCTRGLRLCSFISFSFSSSKKSVREGRHEGPRSRERDVEKES